MSLSRAVKEAQREMGRNGITDRLHWVYRCHSCARLITKIEILEARSAGRINLCPCGSKVIRPTNAKVWEELLLPRCWRLIYAIYTQSLAPAPPPMSKEDQREADRIGKAANRAFEKQQVEMARRREAI